MMISRKLRQREICSSLAWFFFSLCAALCFALLIFSAADMLRRGFAAFSLQLFAGAEDLKGAFITHTKLVLTAALVAAPLGLTAGIYLSEAGWYSKAARFTTALNDISVSTPPLVSAVCVYLIAGKYMESGFIPGVMALVIFMTPYIARTSSEMLRVAPLLQKEAAFALGARPPSVLRRITLPFVWHEILIWVLIICVFTAGEAALLLFSADTATVKIFHMAHSSQTQTLAWGGAFLILLFTLMFVLTGRKLLRKVI